ncbi:hypothetical protein ACFU9X_33175 [Streptomyces atratus]|uniref:hypothetical protein n=1 Tax=Streptomyces atratus TaxID=1893 RepID=UPI00367616F4
MRSIAATSAQVTQLALCMAPVVGPGLHGELQLQNPNDLWKHPTSIAGGRCTTSNKWADDLLVRWSDGEVTLYTDVNHDGFHGEKKLAAPNGTWKHAATITSGDFTGNDQHDLIVRWTDGELTLYKDIDQNGFHGEIQVKKPNRLWTHATMLGAGDYTDNRHPDDFLVRWSDGEVSATGTRSQQGSEKLTGCHTDLDPPLVEAGRGGCANVGHMRVRAGTRHAPSCLSRWDQPWNRCVRTGGISRRTLCRSGFL